MCLVKPDYALASVRGSNEESSYSGSRSILIDKCSVLCTLWDLQWHMKDISRVRVSLRVSTGLVSVSCASGVATYSAQVSLLY